MCIRDSHYCHLPHCQLNHIGKNLTSACNCGQAFFEKLCWEGLERRYGPNVPQANKDRLEYEIGVVKKMGYTCLLYTSPLKTTR